MMHGRKNIKLHSGRFVFMVGQFEGKTQLVQCFYSCAVTYFIVKLLWLFNNGASLSETDNI